VDFLLTGRAGAARFLLPLTIVAALAAGAAMAQDDDPPSEEPGVSEPGDPGEGGGFDGDPGDGDAVWEDDPIVWNEPPIEPGDGEEYLYDGGGDAVDGEGCDGCEAWITGGERPVMENARGDAIARSPDNSRGKDGGSCSEDGFIPLPWRCSW
jgi:hypothetical protein